MDPPPRRGRKTLAVGALIAFAVVGSFLIWRATSLVGIPRLVEPFDTAGLGTVAIPEGLNAFTYYRQAVARFHDDPSLGGPYLSWSQASQRDREWLYANAEAMELWFVGTTMDRAIDFQPKDFRIETRLDVVQTLRRMVRLSLLAGLRMEAQGDLEEAWGWYRAALRCSRHCGKGDGFIGRLIGCQMYGKVEAKVRAWIDHPNQSPSGLRRALHDLLAIDAMSPTLGEALRVEYFAFASYLDNPDLSLAKILREVAETQVLIEETPLHPAKEALWRLVLREPERSRRVLRLVWANWLSAADQPIEERAGRGHKLAHGYFYDPPADATGPVRHLTPDRLNGWVGSTRYLSAMLPGYVENVEQALRKEAAARGSLIVATAEQLYIRDNGHPPASADQLVGPYLKALPEGFVPPMAGAK